MTEQEFRLNVKALRAQYEVQLLTGSEYNRKLLELHVAHAAALLVEQPGPKVFEVPAPALALGLTRSQVDWARAHDWFLNSGLDVDGYYVVVRDDVRVGKESTFRDYKALRAWAGY